MISKNEVKYIQSLYHKKTRQELGLFVAEGVKAVDELICSGWKIERLYATEGWQPQHTPGLKASIITEDELSRISNLQSPNKVLAVVEMPKPVEPVTANKFVIALDALQDPGNLGTIIRLADWFGIDQIVASPDTVDCFNPKVVQATMGSIARVRVCYVDLKLLLSRQDAFVVGAVLNGRSVYELLPLNEAILLIGNEGKGISEDLLPLITQAVTIPGKGKAESLNAGIAAGILLSHLIPH